MEPRNGIDASRRGRALGWSQSKSPHGMRINRHNERILVIRPGVPEGCCLAELAERCGFRVGQICHELGCSTAHFRNVFVRDTGIPPKRWIEELRVARVRESLEAGAAAGELALSMGFSCSASLKRALSRNLPEWFSRLQKTDAAGVETAGAEDVSPLGGIRGQAAVVPGAAAPRKRSPPGLVRGRRAVSLPA